MSVVSGALDVSGGTPPLLARPSSPQSGNNKELESSHKLTPARFSIEKGWYRISYIYDYIVLVVLILILGILSLSVEPYRRAVPNASENVNVLYPALDNTIPSYAAVLLAYGTPTVALLICCARKQLSPMLHELHHGLLSLVLSVFTVLVFTEIGKVFAGRQRPNYIAFLTENSLSVGDKDEWDERKSFPSGHSAVIFNGMTWLSLYLAAKLRALTPNGGEYWKIFIVGIPQITAWLIAISRTRDYHHDFDDVLAGSLIGLLWTFPAYLCYFPLPTDPACHLPKTRARHPVVFDPPLEV